MFNAIVKSICVAMWIAGFVLLILAYFTSVETYNLYAGKHLEPDGTTVDGFNPDTGVKSTVVLQSERLAKYQGWSGVAAIVGGALLGLAVAFMERKRRLRRRRSGSKSGSHHWATRIPRRRPSSKSAPQ